MKKNYLLRIASISLVFLFVAFWANSVRAEEYITNPSELPDADLYKSVVKIKSFYSMDHDNLLQYSEGSGIIISSDGIILTNYHVVTLEDEFNEGEYESAYQICLPTAIDQEPDCHYMAKLIAKDKDQDVALLKIQTINGLSNKTDNFDYLDLANGDNTSVNDTVMVMGYPSIGGNTITITKGIISGKEEKYNNKWIKTDAVFSFGSSGGAAIDDQGNVIGLVSFAHSDYLGSLGYLINIASIKNWVDVYQSLTPEESQYRTKLEDFTKRQVALEDASKFSNDYFSFTKPSGWEFTYVHEYEISVDNPSDDDGGFVTIKMLRYPYDVSLDAALIAVKETFTKLGVISLINFSSIEDALINGQPAKKVVFSYGPNTETIYYLVNHNYILEVDYDYGLNNKDEDTINGVFDSLELVSNNSPIHAPIQYTNDSPQFTIKSSGNWHILEHVSKDSPIKVYNDEMPEAYIKFNVEQGDENTRNYNNQQYLDYLKQSITDFNNVSSDLDMTVEIIAEDADYVLNSTLNSIIYFAQSYIKKSTQEVLFRDTDYIIKSGNKRIYMTFRMFGGTESEYQNILADAKSIINTFSLSTSPYQGDDSEIVEEPDETPDEPQEPQEPASQPKYTSPVSYGPLSQRLKGRILLQVEEHGEAWYVNPDTGNRIYMKDGETAYDMMRELGLGISNENLAKIPVGIEDRFESHDTDGDGLPDKLEEGLGTDASNTDTDGDGYDDRTEILSGYNPLGSGAINYDNRLINSLLGKIVLQVESRGEAWYINPVDGKRYYMKDGQAAYQIMRYLSLGITNSDLEQIPQE